MMGLCGECRFWDFLNMDGKRFHQGYCLRYPPTVAPVVSPQDGSVSWETVRPQTDDDDRCGEWKKVD